jgi:hypothetical protein
VAWEVQHNGSHLSQGGRGGGAFPQVATPVIGGSDPQVSLDLEVYPCITDFCFAQKVRGKAGTCDHG